MRPFHQALKGSFNDGGRSSKNSKAVEERGHLICTCTEDEVGGSSDTIRAIYPCWMAS